MTVLANRLFLNKRCEFWFDGEHSAVPVAQCTAGQLRGAINALAGNEVVVEFRTTEQAEDAASDIRKYTKRLLSTEWQMTEWAPKMIRGLAIGNMYACVIRRVHV